MWIRGTLRLVTVALLDIEISIIALASAASAAPTPPDGGTARTPPPVIRTHDPGEPAYGPWWYADIEHPGGDTAAQMGDVLTRTERAYERYLTDWGPYNWPQPLPWRSRALDDAFRDAWAPRQDAVGSARHSTGEQARASARALTQVNAAAGEGKRTAATATGSGITEARRVGVAVVRSRPIAPAGAGVARKVQADVAARTKAEARKAQADVAARARTQARKGQTGLAGQAKAEARKGQAGLAGQARAEARKGQVNLRQAMPRQATLHLTHTIASTWLKRAGLRMKSSGNCTSRHVGTCTSLDSVRTSTVARVIQLKRASGCPVLVTGGTETGHAPGHFSHGNGYKLDITHNPCIDRYITKNHATAGTRSDGARLYRSRNGTVFADEIDHWDILFR